MVDYIIINSLMGPMDGDIRMHMYDFLEKKLSLDFAFVIRLNFKEYKQPISKPDNRMPNFPVIRRRVHS